MPYGVSLAMGAVAVAFSPTLLPLPPPGGCACCGAAAAVQRCRLCLGARYCSQACCAQHWDQHSQECKMLRLRAVPAALLREMMPAALDGSGADGTAVCSTRVSLTPAKLLSVSELAAMRLTLDGWDCGAWRSEGELVRALHGIDWRDLAACLLSVD